MNSFSVWKSRVVPAKTLELPGSAAKARSGMAELRLGLGLGDGRGVVGGEGEALPGGGGGQQVPGGRVQHIWCLVQRCLASGAVVQWCSDAVVPDLNYSGVALGTPAARQFTTCRVEVVVVVVVMVVELMVVEVVVVVVMVGFMVVMVGMVLVVWGTLRERAMVDMARCEVLGIHWSSSLPAPRPPSHPSTAALDLQVQVQVQVSDGRDQDLEVQTKTRKVLVPIPRPVICPTKNIKFL